MTYFGVDAFFIFSVLVQSINIRIELVASQKHLVMAVLNRMIKNRQIFSRHLTRQVLWLRQSFPL
jgi:hypothetical protein